jgi:hypothetical protein
MIQTLIRNWWLLALCGVIEAAYAVVNAVTQNPDSSFVLRQFAGQSTVVLLLRMAVAAGICAVAAGIWRSGKGKSWLLALNGLSLILFGVAGMLLRHRKVSFLPFALLLVVMALSAGVFEFGLARTLTLHAVERWFLAVTGAAWVGFAVAFLAFGLRLVRFGAPDSYVLWMSSYFAFSAVCMLMMGLRLSRIGDAIHRSAGHASLA